VASPEDQIKQILSIAPIVDGERRSSKYDIPPHHPQADMAGTAKPLPSQHVRGESGLIDFSAPVEKNHVVSQGGPALVPTNRGVAPAGKLSDSGLQNMKDLQTAVPKDGDSDDDFVDCR